MNPHLYHNLLNNSIIEVVFLNVCVVKMNINKITEHPLYTTLIE